jgi:hypothetical protein
MMTKEARQHVGRIWWTRIPGPSLALINRLAQSTHRRLIPFYFRTMMHRDLMLPNQVDRPRPTEGSIAGELTLFLV